MKTLSIVMLAGLLSAAPCLADPDQHHHHGDDEVLSLLVLNEGAKWPVDEVLSAAMLRLRAGLVRHLDAIHHKRFSTPQYQQLAKKLQQEINHIVANCDLTPEADAQFHLILAAMLQSQQAMAADDEARQRQGAVHLFNALQRYPEFFKDDVFLPIEH